MLPSVLAAALQDLQTPGRRVFNRKAKDPPSTDSPAGLRALGDRRLILVSNREPYVRKRTPDGVRFERTAGGLVTALDPVMRGSGGVWVAWQPESEAQMDARFLVPAEPPQFTQRQVPLTKREVARYYYGFANRALWPLFHYFLDRCRFDEEDWQQYVRVNERFADVTVEEAKAGDLVWVHDYHFCLLPQMIRERRRGDDPIAFFLHIPFPPEEVFRILPWRRQVLSGLLGADLVGFHTPEYAGDFLGCCERLLGAQVDHRRGIVRWQKREVRVGAFPIGIDVAEFAEAAAQPAAAERGARVRQSIVGGSGQLILGVDRLDYSKGIVERLHAIDVLLEKHPELRRKFVFLQVAVPSRTQVKEYGELKRRIDELVGRINGKYGTPRWQPIRYLYRSVPRPELVALYRAADVCFVTPLRDGMNLVAMEFVACQRDGAGVLVLSEFTGASQQLGKGAVLVNPFAVHETAETLAAVLGMSEEDRRERMAELQLRVVECDVHSWLENVLAAALGQDGKPRLRSRGGAA